MKERDMVITVYGAGCKKCHALLENTKAAVEQMGLDAQVEYVTDMAQVAAKGIMSTPALAVDGGVVSTGRVLTSDEVAAYIRG